MKKWSNDDNLEHPPVGLEACNSLIMRTLFAQT
jgi:hypothetical protein